MSALLARIKGEPALVSALVAAAIALLTAFGPDLTPEQVAGIMGITAAILALFVRSQVTPTADVVAQVDSIGDVVAGPASPVADGLPVDVTPAG